MQLFRNYLRITTLNQMGTKFSKRNVNDSVKILTGKVDAYSGVTIISSEYKFIQRKQASKILAESLKKWQESKFHSIWFQIDVNDIWWLPILLKNGFVLHHAQPNYVMVTKWLLSRPCSLPKYAFTFIGAGGLVVNNKGEILLMKERSGPYLGWKFPGGAADYGELIHETAIREVFEETGLETEFVTLLAFRHSSQFIYENASNIYFICVLRPKDENNLELKPCPKETDDCRWMSRDEINDLDERKFRWYGLEVLKHYDEWKKSGHRGCFYNEFHRKPPVENKDGIPEANSDNKRLNKSTNPNIATGFYLID